MLGNAATESMDKVAGEDEQVNERGERLAAWFFSYLFSQVLAGLNPVEDNRKYNRET